MNKIKKFFNMVEITLALAVIGIGIAGVMSLFPVGVQATRDSIADNYASNAADQITTLISLLCQADWAHFVETNSVIGAKPADDKIEPGDLSNCNKDLGGNFNNIKSDVNLLDGSGGTAGVFKVTQGSEAATDFTAFIRVWKEQIPEMSIAGSSTGSVLPYTYGAAMHIEISYPAEIPYDKRQKKYYYFEIFNPDPKP